MKNAEVAAAAVELDGKQEKLAMNSKTIETGLRFFVDDDGDINFAVQRLLRGRTIDENLELVQTFNRFRAVRVDENRTEWVISLNPGDQSTYQQFFSWIKKQNPTERMKMVIHEFEQYYAKYLLLLEKRLEVVKQTGKSTFADLKQLLRVGEKCVVTTPYDEQLQGGIITSINTQSYWGMYFLNIEYKVVTPDDGKIFLLEKSARIPYFTGYRSLQELPIRTPTNEEIDMLMERGLLYKEYLSHPHYLEYTGNMFRKNWIFLNEYRSDGRIMVDVSSFCKFEPDYHRPHDGDEIELAGEMMFTCPPMIYGYSMRLKMWGEFHIKNLSPIEFRKDAFDLLVMDEERKEIVKALIETKTDFNDLINGKGGGVIFLLHGTPGVGKTLTAEAVSEVLKQPLYSVSVGELGTSATELEENLRSILELATVWNAILLIDEADIFLEKRTANDIQRNAMVAIFLRMLEYYGGVLFLTTNRVKTIDPAFESRISLPIQYDPLEFSAREQIWRNLISSQNMEYDLDDNDFQSLSTYENNGREIKSIIRMSMTLAKSRDEKLNIQHINRIIKLRVRSVCAD